MDLKSQNGSIPTIMMVAIFGLLAFLLVFSSAPFKSKIFGPLYPKPASKAAAGAGFTLSPPNTNATQGNQTSLQLLANTAGVSGNLFSAKITFDASRIQVASIDQTGS